MLLAYIWGMLLRKSIIIKAIVLFSCCFCYTFSTQSSLFNSRISLNIFTLSAEKQSIVGHIIEAAERNSIHPALIAAVIHAESNFNTKAKSYAGAMGLMQINGVTAKYLKIKNVYDPKSNIEAGARYLKELYALFGKLELAIAAYNAGPGAVKKYKGIPPYKETKNYVARVLQLFDQYKSGASI